MLRGFGLGATALAMCFTVGCGGSDKPPAEGGLTLNIGTALDPPDGKACTIKSHYASLGSVPPSATTKGKPVVDGEGGRVSCSASGGSTVTFGGSISKGTVSFRIFDGQVPKDGVGTALIQEKDPDSGTQLETPADSPCTVDVSKEELRANDDTIWAELVCPALISKDQPSLFCAVSSGILLLQNCD